MDKGSYQIECSDEGLMHEKIESCLRPVIAAAKSSGGREWALKMLRHDRIRVFSANTSFPSWLAFQDRGVKGVRLPINELSPDPAEGPRSWRREAGE